MQPFTDSIEKLDAYHAATDAPHKARKQKVEQAQSGRSHRRLGITFIIFSALQPVVFLLAALASVTLPWLGMLGRTETEVEILMLTPLLGGWSFCAISAILLLPSLVSGIAIVKRREWGRICGIITAVLALLESPLGTAFGIYALKRF